VSDVTLEFFSVFRPSISSSSSVSAYLYIVIAL